ncbi:MAG: hypothetical protein HGB34_04030 [Candidatus Moranbacteria bacterium]|nr:hypothetical protein [Candidatus Moranbacteria bacterium]
MNHSERLMRRVRLVSAVAFFLFIVGMAAYFLLRTPPTCVDGKRNQGEIGIDCGGKCDACPEMLSPDPFVIREAEVVPGNVSGEYDVVAKIYNPNDMIGASEVTYDVSLHDASGVIMGRVSGTDSILPQETKTILLLGIVTTQTPVSVEVSFRDERWQRFSGYQERPKLTLYRTRFDTLSSGPFYGEAFGTLRNDSSFDFRSVTIKVILRDATGKPVALNQTEINTLLSGDIRDFTLRWPKAFPGNASSVEAVADTDFYHEENFIERYRSGNEQFQSLQ